MKRVSKTWLFVYLILLVAGSCTQTDVEEDDIPLHALKEVDAGFILNVLANRPPPQTYRRRQSAAALAHTSSHPL